MAWVTGRRWWLGRALAAAVVLVALALHASVASAEPHHVCVYLDIGDELWDASPRAADGEEFYEEHGRNEGARSYPAQRWLARVRDEATDAVLYGWEPLDGAGCAALELPPGTTELAVEWMRWAVWEDGPDTGNQLVGYRCDAAMTDCTVDRSLVFLPANLVTGTTEVIVTIDDMLVPQIDSTFWATTFAEERLASIGEQPLEDTRIYVGHDPLDVLPGATQADRTFGNQPSVVIEGDAWHSKFTIAHELGHQQTIIALHPSFGSADLDYCHDPAVYPVTGGGCSPNHSMDSHEWQAVAAIEGIAHWYAVSVWNDVDFIECQNCIAKTRYVKPASAVQAQTYIVPRTTPLCTTQDAPQCPAGVGNEWDWLSAFRLFRLDAPSTPSLRTMLTMVSAAYANGTWSVNDASNAFWVAFDQAMIGHLGSNHAAWQQAASQMALDR